MDAMKQSDPTIQLKGHLCVHSAPHLDLSNDRSDDPNWLLFELHDPTTDASKDFGREVEYTLRLMKPGAAESSNSKDSLTPREAMLCDSSSWMQAVLYNAATETTDLRLEDDDLYEIAELPTRHIVLGKGEMGKALVRRIVKRHVVTLGLPYEDAIRHLPVLLDDLGPSARLRLISIHMSDQDRLDFESMRPLLWRMSVSGVHGIFFVINLSAVSDVEVEGWERAMQLHCARRSSLIVDMCESMTSVRLILHEFRLNRYHADKRLLGSKAMGVKHLYVEGGYDIALPVMTTVTDSLTRLDIRENNCGDIRLQSLQDVLDAVKKSVIIDLGLPIWFTEVLNILFDSKLHSRIRVLRLHFQHDPSQNFHKAWRLLILDEISTVQFFDCTFEVDILSITLRGLAGSKPPAALTALRVRSTRFQGVSDFFSDVANYLSSPAACNLVYLDLNQGFQHLDSSVTSAGNWLVANSLSNNFALCSLNFPFTETAAESYAITLLSRNRLYRGSDLLNVQVAPNVAKLFLCGHGRVGKTTLRRALLSMQYLWPISSLYRRYSRPDPTRGIETRYLSFQHLCKKLLICDLAGQEEYHVFHHYFMNASINDIFIVVCKYDNSGLSLETFRLQLDYWLRFIVSHRNIRNKSFDDSGANLMERKPKVIVVVNFFQHEEDADYITREWTSPLMQKFSEVLDFAVAAETQQHKSYKNLFGLNAWKGFGVQELTERLEALLRDLDITALPIPKLCYDISARLTPGHRKNWPGASTLATGKGKIRFLTFYIEVLNAVSHSNPAAGDLSSIVQAALRELHTQGYIIFFPSEGTGAADGWSNGMKRELVAKNSTNDTLVITDTNWFCNKVVGSLLGTRLSGNRSCPWLWKVEEIKKMLRRQGCSEHEHEEILRYLKHLELCVSLESVSGGEKGYLLFPALVEEKEIEFPEGSKESSTTFFGRRLKCQDPSIHLIPSAIFTRLQVKMHRAYAAKNETFKLGNGWISFTRGRVGAVVRYGGDMMNDAWENKQQIDILIFCPEIHGRNFLPSTSSNTESYQHGHMVNDPKLKAAEAVLDEIRSHVFSTCKEGGLGGIPTVDIEEMVLQSKTESSDYCCLSHILNNVRKAEKLLEIYQEWRTAVSTPVLELLLPKEVEAVMRDRFNALASIQEEFSQGAEDDGSEDAQCVDTHQSRDAICDSQLSSDLDIKLFIKSQFTDLKKYLDTNFQTVRADIRKLENVQRQVMEKIIANCSTRLLRHELRKDRAYGLYPYLVDVEGKLAPLWEALFGKRVVRVQFLCESPTEGGPHLVKDQKGKEVSIDWKPWVKKATRVMVPAVKVICLLARVAATVYLPSAQVFIPSPEALVSGLGIETEALQHVILPQALEALLKNVPDVDWRELMKRGRPEEQEVQEVVAAMLQNKDVDMWADFSLKRVIFDDDEQSIHHRALWVCNRHARQKAELRPIKNPYGTSESSPL